MNSPSPRQGLNSFCPVTHQILQKNSCPSQLLHIGNHRAVYSPAPRVLLSKVFISSLCSAGCDLLKTSSREEEGKLMSAMQIRLIYILMQSATITKSTQLGEDSSYFVQLCNYHIPFNPQINSCIQNYLRCFSNYTQLGSIRKVNKCCDVPIR